jgi:hypothetical protein
MKKHALMTLMIALMVLVALAPAAESIAQARVERVKAFVVTILSDRFDPPEAVISDRKFMLVIYSDDGLQAHEYSFDRLGAAGAPVAQIRREQTPQFSKRSVHVFDLQPGQYRLTEIRSGRTFNLTVR